MDVTTTACARGDVSPFSVPARIFVCPRRALLATRSPCRIPFLPTWRNHTTRIGCVPAVTPCWLRVWWFMRFRPWTTGSRVSAYALLGFILFAPLNNRRAARTSLLILPTSATCLSLCYRPLLPSPNLCRHAYSHYASFPATNIAQQRIIPPAPSPHNLRDINTFLYLLPVRYIPLAMPLGDIPCADDAARRSGSIGIFFRSGRHM